jgi:hypothetical protein
MRLLLETGLRSSSGGGVCGKVSTNLLLFVSGSSILSSSLCEGVERFSEIGAMVRKPQGDGD